MSNWRESLFQQLNFSSSRYYRLKGFLFYRWIFRQFGKGSEIRKPILISHPQFISIGDRVFIRDGVRLEAIQTNPLRIPDLRIGDYTNIEQNVHVVCHSRVHIGSRVSITGDCAIVDVSHPFDDVEDPRKIGDRILDEDSFVEIGDGSFLGYGTVVLPNVRIGKYVITAARSVITADVPDYSVVVGAPARVIKRYHHDSGLWVPVSQNAERLATPARA